MDEIETQLTDTAESTETTDTAAEPQETTETTENNYDSQTLAEVLNGKEDKPQEVKELWKETNQYKQGLWKTPDDVMRSAQYYEKRYQPLEQYIQRMGFKEPSQLEQVLKDYQERLPQYQEAEATINQLNALLQDQNYGSKLRDALNEIRRAQETERFGMAFDDLPPIIKERVVKGEQAFQQLEEMKQEQAYNNALSTIQEQMQQIEQIVQETGLDFVPENFLKYCRDNNISPSNMKGEFLNAYYTQMLEKAKQAASLATTAQNKQNKANALNSSTKQTPAQPKPKMNDISDLEKALYQIE